MFYINVIDLLLIWFIDLHSDAESPMYCFDEGEGGQKNSGMLFSQHTVGFLFASKKCQ